ncbi:unknown [Clostridium sp. CAG:277]|nr:unknown [Clostridium sp. CAG:277]
MEYGSKVRKEDDLVIEEDTIYEIDRECEACRQRIMKGRW